MLAQLEHPVESSILWQTPDGQAYLAAIPTLARGGALPTRDPRGRPVSV